jgi:hypothetical protein
MAGVDQHRSVGQPHRQGELSPTSSDLLAAEPLAIAGPWLAALRS